MSPLSVEGINGFYAMEAHRIQGIEDHRKVNVDKAVVPEHGVLELRGPLGEVIDVGAGLVPRPGAGPV